MRATLPGVALFLALAPAAVRAAAPEAATTSFTLPNGLVGVVIEDHRAPVVTHMVWYKVGSADEPPGQSGIAHFLEHLMFKGTDRLADGAFSRVVAANGGEDNAFTTPDYTAYHQRIAADRLDLVMGMEADRMVNLDPGEGAVLSERDVVLEERRQRVGNTPDGLFGEALEAALYVNHPYRHPVIGWEHEVAGLGREAAMAFYRAHYAPNNAVLVVAGDVDPDEVQRLAEAHFGPIPPAAIAPRIRPQEPPPVAARRIVMEDARVREPYVARLYPATQRKPGDQAEAAALTVLAELLGRVGGHLRHGAWARARRRCRARFRGGLFRHRRRPAELQLLCGAEARGAPRRGRSAARRADRRLPGRGTGSGAARTHPDADAGGRDL